MVEDRERVFRGADAALVSAIPAFVAFLLFAMASMGDPILYGVGGVVSLLAIGMVVRWPRRVRIRDGVVEVSRFGRQRRLGAAELRGVRFAAAADVNVPVAHVATLVFAGCTLPVFTFRRPQRLWTAFEDVLFGPASERIARDLLAGKEVGVGAFTLRRAGFSYHKIDARWPEELQRMSLRPDGYLITLADRPQDAIVVRPGALNPVPLLATIAELMVAATATLDRPPRARAPDGSPYRETEAPPATDAPASTATPPPGMPAEHPELGPMVFAYRASRLANLAVVMGSAFGVGFLASLVGYVVLGKDHGFVEAAQWITIGCLVMTFALLGLLRLTDWARRDANPRPARGTGRDFVVYRGGIADRRGGLRWRDTRAITLSATRRYVNGQYEGDTYGFGIGSPARFFHMSGTGPRFEAYFQWFADTVLPQLAQRDLAKIGLGESLTYAGLVVDKTGIRKGGREASWSGLAASVDNGTLKLGGALELELNAPNGRLLLAVIEAKRQAQAESAV